MTGLAYFLIAELKLKSLQRKSRINKAHDDKEAMHNQHGILCELQLIMTQPEPGERPLGKMICSRHDALSMKTLATDEKPLDRSPK